ncbi:MAG: glycosyltransferase [Verrucomicrobiota bacterium]
MEKSQESGDRVSVLIPCYNAEKWIEQAIQSVLGQSVPVGEIIVYDDASLDRSVSVIEQYSGDVQMIGSREHLGGQRARNELLKRARGEWVQFLDADDYLQERKIEADLRVVESIQGIDVVISPTLREYYPSGDLGKIHELAEGVDLWLKWISWNLPQTGGFLWKKSAIEKIGEWNESWENCQDYELSSRALQCGLKFGVAKNLENRSQAVYRQWSDSTVSKKNIQSVIENRTRLILSVIHFLGDSGLMKSEYKEAAGVAFFEMFRSYAAMDLPGAQRYLEGLPESLPPLVKGEAAPLKYKMVASILGLMLAERIAKLLR